MNTNYKALFQSSCAAIKNQDASLIKPQDLPDELELQSHWFSGHFGLDFISEEGETIKIKQLGFWNRSAGADFLHCSIEKNGTLHTGAIELDLSPQHWQLHRHHENPAFQKVILHVVFSGENQKTFTKDCNNRHITRVQITAEKIAQALQQPRNRQLTAHPGRCSESLEKASQQTITKLLESAAHQRITDKVQRQKQSEQANGKEQTLWINIASTLGYSANTLPFTLLAQRLPIAQLNQHSGKEIQSILFGAANFLHPTLHEKAPPESREWLEDLWQTWWKLRKNYELAPERQIPWKMSGSRPLNHPHRRLAALSQIAQHWQQIQQTTVTEITKKLENLKDPFWNHHYTLTSKRSEKSLKLIGKSRIQDLLINHLLPRKIQENDLAAWDFYKKIPAPVVSENVKRASIRLLGKHPQYKEFLKKAWQHQAFLQFYQDFCLRDWSNCQDCPFPEQFTKWVEPSKEF